MATIDKSQSPYFDTYNVEDKKGYIQLLFNPDRPLQQRELNELQSMLNSSLRQISDASNFKDGNILSGIRPVYKDITDTTMNVVVQEGFIYMNGRAQYVSEQTVNVSVVGDAYIYATYEEAVVTPDQDSSLLDPTIGSPSVSSRGADRLKGYVTLSATPTDTGRELFHFQDGSLFIQNNNDLTGPMLDILARQTFETNGSYRVRGLELSIDPTQSENGKISVLVSDGIAYVRGYRIDKPTQQRMTIPVASTTRTMVEESHAYDTSSQYITLYNRPVSNVASVTAPVLVTETVSRRGSSSDALIDPLQNSNVIAIKSITSTKGTVIGSLDNPASAGGVADFEITNGNSIKWRQGSNVIPTSGSSYQVQYWYRKVMVVGTDYKITVDNTVTDRYGLNPTYIDFRGMNGDKPGTLSVLGSVSVTYDYYLARRDLITMDSGGFLTSIPGEPDTIDKVALTSKYDDTVFPIGWVTAYPNSQNATTNSYTVTNLTFSELQKMQARLTSVEYNLANLAQDVAAQTGHDPVTLRGIFSDGFIRIDDKFDSSIFGDVVTDDDGNITSDNRWRENGEVVEQVAFSPDDAMITLPYKSQTSQGLNISSVTTDKEYNNPMNWTGKTISAPYKIVTEIKQRIATGVTNINPYMVYATQTGSLKLSPSVDTWVDTEKVTVNNVTTKQLKVYRFWNHQGKNATKDSKFLYDNMNNIQWTNTDLEWLKTGKGEYRDNFGGYRGTAQGSTVTNGGVQTVNSMIPYMRSIQVSFTATGLRPFDDNLYIEFNHVKVTTNPKSPATAGATKGTIKADASGKVAGTFKIPAGQPTGTVDVFLKNDAKVGSSANSSFTSKGTKTTVKQIINTTFYQVKMVDPLAQSFQFSGDRIVAGVNLYFNAVDKSSTAAPVIVQIRPLADGGMPSQQVLGEVSMEAKSIKTSTDASVPTSFYFDDPVMLEDGKSYAVVIMTNSQGYLVYSAKMGEKRVDKGSKSRLTTNAYEGVMFSSANAQSWTVHQDQDLTFDIMTVQFKEGTDAVVEFDPVTFKADEEGNLPDITVATVDAYTPDNSGVKWTYRVVLQSEPTGASITDGTHAWHPVGEFGEYDPGAQIRTLQIKATFQPSKYSSPMLSQEVVTLGSVLTNLKGTYVGKTVNMGGAGYFNTVTYEYTSYTPTGTSVTPKFLFWADGASQPQTWETLDSLTANHGVPKIVPTLLGPDENGMFVYSATFTLPKSYAGELGFSNMKVRLDLESKTSFVRPRVRGLKVVLTDQ